MVLPSNEVVEIVVIESPTAWISTTGLAKNAARDGAAWAIDVAACDAAVLFNHA